MVRLEYIRIMMGHTGVMMIMGKGDIFNIARKHKINVANSTELELVGIAGVLDIIYGVRLH